MNETLRQILTGTMIALSTVGFCFCMWMLAQAINAPFSRLRKRIEKLEDLTRCFQYEDYSTQKYEINREIYRVERELKERIKKLENYNDNREEETATDIS